MWCILGLEPNLQPNSQCATNYTKIQDKLHIVDIYQHKANINSKNLLLHQEQEHPSISQTSQGQLFGITDYLMAEH